MRKRFLAIAVIGLAAEPAAAMPVSTFLTKIDALARAGAVAAASSDGQLIKKELEDDAAALHDERVAAASAGNTPAYCPAPQSGPPSLDEIVASLKEVPKAKRGKTEVRDALRAYLAQRFPCNK
ncbi:MAG TPA: hypothetical protein VFK19_12510 [Sphingomicrobium sp.]|nr:hypothetical protein [Sphingomicrobium sp.]